MHWTSPVDAYCERIGSGLWAEPLNLATNLAFVMAAAVMFRRCRGRPAGQALAALLLAIGLGSGLFHSVAERWAALADTLPILLFILACLYLANRDYLRLRPAVAAAVTALYLPWSAALVPVFARTGIGSSAAYAPVPLLILLYAALLRRRAPTTARGLAAGAGILILSLAARTLDTPLCPRFPPGTHWLWHLLNALMLAWMIEVWRRHRPAGREARPHRLARNTLGG